MITKPTTKFALVDTQGVVVDGATEIDVTNDVGSWKELEIEQCREDTTGVISEVSFPITFHFAAKELLEKLFETNGFYAEALFRIYKRADFSDDYTLVREMRLDFSTYKADRNGVEIESINDDLSEYISSRKSTKYDIKVSEIADSKKWRYERMRLLDRGSWTFPSWDGKTESERNYYTVKVKNTDIATLPMNIFSKLSNTAMRTARASTMIWLLFSFSRRRKVGFRDRSRYPLKPGFAQITLRTLIMRRIYDAYCYGKASDLAIKSLNRGTMWAWLLHPSRTTSGI